MKFKSIVNGPLSRSQCTGSRTFLYSCSFMLAVLNATNILNILTTGMPLGYHWSWSVPIFISFGLWHDPVIQFTWMSVYQKKQTSTRIWRIVRMILTSYAGEFIKHKLLKRFINFKKWSLVNSGQKKGLPEACKNTRLNRYLFIFLMDL